MDKIAINEIRIREGRRTVNQTAVTQLVESINQIGLLNPVTITKGGVLLAGLHRIRACEMLGWTEIPCNRVEIADALLFELAEIDENLIRNDLTVLERAEQELARKVIYEQLYPESKKGGDMSEKLNDIVSFSQDTANKTGVTARTVQRDIQIAKNLTPETKEILRDTPTADVLTDLLKLSRMPDEEQEQIAKVMARDNVSISQARRELQKQNFVEPDMPSGKFRVFYADPPWSYGDKCDNGSVQAGGCERHYPSMSITELCAMPIDELAEDNAVLFLWVTSPLVPEAMQLINAWNFEYKTSFVWDKVKHNMGHYNSVRHELLFVCVKGSCQPDVKKLFDSVVTEERTEHSVKPETFRNIIDTLYTHGNKLELFARTTAEGWTSYGNELSTLDT